MKNQTVENIFSIEQKMREVFTKEDYVSLNTLIKSKRDLYDSIKSKSFEENDIKGFEQLVNTLEVVTNKLNEVLIPKELEVDNYELVRLLSNINIKASKLIIDFNNKLLDLYSKYNKNVYILAKDMDFAYGILWQDIIGENHSNIIYSYDELGHSKIITKGNTYELYQYSPHQRYGRIDFAYIDSKLTEKEISNIKKMLKSQFDYLMFN